MKRDWSTSQNDYCEGSLSPQIAGPVGNSDATCSTWNTATVTGVDIDAIPAGRSRWTKHSISRTLRTPSGHGALPPGYGQPRYFDFGAPVTLHVSHS